MTLIAMTIVATIKMVGMADATIISESNNGSVYQIRFTTPGEKRISLQTVDTQGNVTAVTDQTIFIFANRLVMEKLSTSPSRTDIYGTIDMDNDGTPELLTYNGVHENDGKGNYTKVKKIYNTNLSFNDKSYITDLTKAAGLMAMKPWHVPPLPFWML